MRKLKKNWKQIIAVILIAAFTVTSIPWEGCIVNAEETSSEQMENPEQSGTTKQAEDSDVKEYDVTKEDARLEENTETSTTFDVGNNKKMTVFYDEAVRYEDKNGNLVDYDPSLVKIQDNQSKNNQDITDYSYENAKGDRKHYFPEELTSETPVLMENDGYGISMSPTEDLKKVQVEKEEYADGYEEIKEVPLKAVYKSKDATKSYEYTSTSAGVKEEIVLAECPEGNTFSYDLKLDGLFARKNQLDEGITLYDNKTEEIVGNITPPNMNDATNKAYSEDLTCEVSADEKTEGLYHVTVTADMEYLKDESRQYPVTIDPTATWSGKSDIGDAYVLNGSSYKNTNFYDSGVVVVNAGKGSKGVYRTYFRFLNLTPAVKGYYVDSAVLKLYETANSNSGQTVQAYRVKESFKCADITWNTRPGYDTLYSSVKSTGKYKTERSLNLTTYVRGIANGSLKNYGIMLKGASETGHYCEFVGSRHSTSSLRPKLTVVYYDKPTIATAVTGTPKYLKKGDALKVTWSGITSKSLAYVQYRLATCQEDWTQIETVVNYSSSTKLGTTSSGTATVSASTGWNEGIYQIFVRGVDNGGIAGTGKGFGFYIDGTSPTLNQPTISPESTKENPAESMTPTISWSGASDTYFKQVECKVDNQNYVAMGTNASGTYTIPEGTITGNGEHTVIVRAVDKAGNEKSYQLKYYLHVNGLGFEGFLPNEGSLKIRNEYGKNIISWETSKSLSDNVYYRIYRGNSENFAVDESSLIAEKVKTGYWVDIQSLADKTYYYKIEAVRTNTEGTIEDTALMEQVLSMKGTAPSVLQKKTGSKEYLGYYTFSTPVGSGSIENSSGNLSYEQEDVTLPANQISFDVTRNYNSQLQISGMFGEGWMDSLHKELLMDESGKISFLDSDGSVYTFEKNGDAYQCAQTKDYTLQSAETALAQTPQVMSSLVEGETTGVKAETLVPPLSPLKTAEDALSSLAIGTGDYIIQDDSESEETITETATHAYTLKTKDGILYRFDEGGQLVATAEPHGTYLFYKYTSDGRLSSVNTDTGKEITLSYDEESGLLTTVTLPDETTLNYSYTDGTLTQAAHTSGQDKVSYNYGYTDGKLTSVTDGKAQEYTISYQGEKADKVTYPNQERYELEYQTNQTSVKKFNESGTEIYSTTTQYDTQTGKTLSETSADGDVTSYEYTYAENPYLVTKTTRKIGYEVFDGDKIVFKTEDKVTQTTYDADENVTEEIAEDGTKTAYTYDDTNEWTQDCPKVVNVTLDGKQISNEQSEYDELGDVTEETDSSDPDNVIVTESTYDIYGNEIQSIVTEDGMETSKTISGYDADGNVISEKETSGEVVNEETNTYDVMGRTVKTTDETTGEVTEYTYDYLGRVTKTETTLNGKTLTSTSTYDANGTVVKEVDTSGITTEYTYDAINRVTKRKVTKGTSITYNTTYSYGDVTVQDGKSAREVQNAYIEKESYPDGSTASEKYYDKAGKLVREKANGLYTDYTYDKSGNQVVAYSNGTGAGAADGKVSLTLYNEKGNQSATVVNPEVQNGDYILGTDTIVTKQEYDDKGNVTRETDAKGTVTEYVYDDSARVTEVVQDADGEKISTKASYATDAEGGRTTTTIIDAKGHQSVEVVDAAGLTRSTTDHGDTAQESIATSYEYDERGNQTKITYENDAYKAFTYDNRNLLVKTVLYDSDGKETLQTEYTYDDLQRQTKMVDSQKKDTGFVPYRYTFTGYDDFGRTSWTAEVNSESEPSEETVTSHKVTYQYDTEDKVTGIQYALVGAGGMEGLHYTYNANRWLQSVQAVINGRETPVTIREYTYDAHGKVSEIKEYPDFADGGNTCITKSYAYDALDRVTTMVYKKGTEVLESYAYKYDKNNNITEKTEINNTPSTDADKVNETKAYTYNALGQLIKTEVTDHRDNDSKQTISYQYDKAGNRTKKIKGSAETSYTYNGLDQLLTAVTERGGAEESRSTYTYDVNGNQIQEVSTKAHTTTVNDYDADNRLSKATITSNGSGESGSSTTFTQENLYNGDGQRIQKTEGAKETNYFYQDGVVSYTTEGSADTKAIQNLLGVEGNVIAAEENVPAADETANDSLKYYLYNKDIQGSTTSILNENGAGELSYEYDDFGETEINGSGTFGNEICYTGGIYDASTGLYYLNARYYDPENGRFLTEDTYRGERDSIKEWNLYVYCDNNPINYVDPSGHKKRTIGAGIQVSANSSVSFLDVGIGIEIIYFFKQIKSGIYAYFYGEAGTSTSTIKKNMKKLYRLIKKQPTKLFSKPSFSCAICAFAVQSEPYNKNVKDYTGKFKTKAVSALGWKGFISKGGGFRTVGAGKNFGNSGISYSHSKYWYLGNVGKIFGSLKNKIKKKAKKFFGK
ncbi:MAG: DNRLRE domain-containing protein [Lachnospiraceae bacterium]